MDTTSAAASTLTRSRLSLAIISAAATASAGYFLYQAFVPLPVGGTSPVAEQSRLHRSNAVRRRRRSTAPHQTHEIERPAQHEAEEDDEDDSSFTSAEDSHGDENADVTIRPLADGETLAGANEEHVLDDDWWNDPSSAPLPQRAGQNIVSLLFRVSEDNARRNAYVHRGCQCNACGIAPIRGIRYRCANCADFDLCETCESQGLHIKTHIFYKVKVPAPPFGPRQMQPVWYPGDPETCLRNLPRQQIIKLSKETGFERPELEAFWEQWTFMANTEWRDDPDDLCLAMDRKTFERCLVPSGGYRYTAPNLIHDRMFAFYDTNNDDLISFREFLMGLSYRKQHNKLRKIFEGYDIDRDGFVSRRDFLRIFRAYYVLYKQMHKDILEGLDDQVMSSTEAHQLVSSRQPLSSLFGREGRVPPADGDRHMEGKMFHGNGDITISDGKVGVINEDKPDTADRETILSSLFTKNPESLFSPLMEAASGDGMPASHYWNALLNPPTSIDELPALLTGNERPGNELFVRSRSSMELTPSSTPVRANAGENRSVGVDDVRNDSERPNAISSEAFTDRIPSESQLRAQHQRRAQRVAAMNRKNRISARRQITERWKLRRFYLDEEEGAVPPDGWNDENDVLSRLEGMPENPKSFNAVPLSPRSRSSSKVRFAENTDDYEIRSNPSTSSRSVPERWGGMDIPDAERDAGKEVLYQVTQQAFNELLDMLFKEKEELAIKAADTKDIREKKRSLFEGIDLKEVDKPRPENQENSNSIIDRPRDLSLEQLLRITGYTIDELANFHENTDTLTPDPGNELVGAQPGVEDVEEDSDADSNKAVKGPNNRLPGPSLDPVDLDEEEEVQRDPTMPQFRPNSLQDTTRTFQSPAYTEEEQQEAPRAAGNGVPSASAKGKRRARGSSEDKAHFSAEQLIEWKRIDVAEQEAKERGGWGRLDFREFEEIFKREESERNRLDYLGSWIDFCIP